MPAIALPRELPRETMAEAIFLRICRTVHAGGEPGFRAAGIYRFDSPDRSFGTCYLARDFQTCFFETVVRDTVLNDGRLEIARSEYDSRSVVVLLLETSKVNLVPVHGAGAKKLGVNLADVAGADYAFPQALSKAVHDHASQPHGIVYRSRFDDDALAVVLFDRAKGYVRLFPSSAPTPLAAVPEMGDALGSELEFALV
ncbi:MAG TPA: RES family NAD+ phosphorylase [Polyangiaceae bacterium]|jgi:hypothetical protein|nr:RES family NAD+ phosphorylase [Polyangiaceae bacterium]